MKKIITLTVLLVITFTLAGCGKKDSSTNSEKAKTLSEWMKDGKGVECTVQSPEGEVVVKTKDGKVRMDGIPYADMQTIGTSTELQDGHAIFNGEMAYMWGEDSGMKFNVKEMEEWSKQYNNQETDLETDEFTPEEWAKEMEADGVVYNCDDKKISDDEFKAPEDVEFIDMLEMMRGFESFLSNINNQPVMNQEDIEAELDKIMGQ